MIELDDLDHQIITAFQENGRVSNREVARQIGVSEATVRARLRRLEDNNVVRIRAVGDAARATGLTGNAILGITVSSGEVDSVMEKLLSRSEVVLASTTIGRHDIIAGIVAPDHQQLAQFILEVINRLPGVERTVTYQAIAVVKHDYNWVRLLPS